MSVPKMRGLKEAVEELHQQDGGSALSLYALRSLVASGEVPCVRIGRRVLVNMEVLYAYLGRSSEAPAAAPSGRSISHIG